MKVIEIEKDIFRPLGSAGRVGWKLTNLFVDGKPLVEALNCKGKPLGMYRFISFETNDVYTAEIFGEIIRI